jgi:hypothetical protein
VAVGGEAEIAHHVLAKKGQVCGMRATAHGQCAAERIPGKAQGSGRAILLVLQPAPAISLLLQTAGYSPDISGSWGPSRASSTVDTV